MKEKEQKMISALAELNKANSRLREHEADLKYGVVIANATRDKEVARLTEERNRYMAARDDYQAQYDLAKTNAELGFEQ